MLTSRSAAASGSSPARSGGSSAIARRVFGPVLVLLACLVALPVDSGQHAIAESLPARLSDAEFWRLTTDFSEPNGFFRSENLVSNEHTFQYVIPILQKVARPGGVYLGVAPDQNFSYMVATQPKMAFIVDIRRGNLLQHLMYKALFELSADRADFIARLFSKKRPAGVGPRSSVVELFSALDRVQMTDDVYLDTYRQNLRALREHLLVRHRFPLSAPDLEQLETIYFAFFYEGPNLRYTVSATGLAGPRFGSNFPSFQDLMMQTDWDGQARSYLASEGGFRFIKDLQERNLIVPVVGDFAGPKALRAVGRYVRERGGTISSFYVSNVEQYLFQDLRFEDFARNVATLPVDDASTFIRSVSTRFGYPGNHLWSDGRASALDPIRAFVRDFLAGRIRTYYDVNARSR